MSRLGSMKPFSPEQSSYSEAPNPHDTTGAAVPRRAVLKGGTAAALAGVSVVSVAGPAEAFGEHPHHEVVVPWLDQPAPVPPELAATLSHPLQWERIRYITPNDQFFTVKHYEQPRISRADWRLDVGGLVEHPFALSLPHLQALPRRAVTFALECSGNTGGAPFAIGLIGNARWAGASLRHVLRRARPRDEAIEVVFWGADEGKVTIRDNSGITGPGVTGHVEPDGSGGQDLTITEHFARSMSLEDAMSSHNLLCYEMNGAPLPSDHGGPVRLIAPDWYGVANVKWLTRIELMDSRYQGRFMARDYVSIREEKRDGKTVWTFTSVTHERLKSAPAKVTRRGDNYCVLGAAWGAPISRVEVRVDDGPWHATQLVRNLSRFADSSHGNTFAWALWRWRWGTPSAGEHTITSRAYDKDGNVQPSPDDPYVASRRTFWENNGYITRHVLIP
jgi:DMSO/TMAO reductase YedYZ molybdopterin-dependent catalytic subunit